MLLSGPSFTIYCCQGTVGQNSLQRSAQCALLTSTCLGKIRTPWSICFLCGLSSTVAVADFIRKLTSFCHTLSPDLEKIQLIGTLSTDWVTCVLLLIVMYLYTDVLVSQSYLILCNPMDCSLPGSSFHGILQASILEWVAIPFTRGSFQPRDWTQAFCIIGGLYHLSHQGRPSFVIITVHSVTNNCYQLSFVYKTLLFLNCFCIMIAFDTQSLSISAWHGLWVSH